MTLGNRPTRRPGNRNYDLDRPKLEPLLRSVDGGVEVERLEIGGGKLIGAVLLLETFT